jgi:protein subunit release factor A
MWRNPPPTLRLTHLESGIEVTVGLERSQHKTLQRALRILRARLYARLKGLRTIEEAGIVKPTVIDLNHVQVDIDNERYFIHFKP